MQVAAIIVFITIFWLFTNIGSDSGYASVVITAMPLLSPSPVMIMMMMTTRRCTFFQQQQYHHKWQQPQQQQLSFRNFRLSGRNSHHPTRSRTTTTTTTRLDVTKRPSCGWNFRTTKVQVNSVIWSRTSLINLLSSRQHPHYSSRTSTGADCWMLSSSKNSQQQQQQQSQQSISSSSSQSSLSSLQTLMNPVGNAGQSLHVGTELVTKKSRFIGYALQVPSWLEAQQIITTVKHQHPKARHWCYGYRSSNDEERSSDDGEPTGTGGAPILSALRTEQIVNVICIVVRYYGGIQLGTGGLIRAYGTAARNVLRESPKQIRIPTQTVHVTVSPDMIGTLYDCINKMNGTYTIQNTEEYDEQGNLSLTIACEVTTHDRFQESLYDSTRGNVIFSSK
jgi:uncharacterized YigZ family protein